jgi:hypothetical protein
MGRTLGKRLQEADGNARLSSFSTSDTPDRSTADGVEETQRRDPVTTPEAPDDDFVESRRAYRHRVLKGATIIHGIRSSETSCVLRNQHSDGAELLVAADTMIPSEFILYVPVDGTGYKAVLRWRLQNRAGVQFLGIEPKPRHHYG